MIQKLDVSSNNFKIGDDISKYINKRIGKLDKYLPKNYKKDIIAKIVISEVNLDRGNKYEISAAMEIPGGKVIAAKEECSNMYAGIDLIEAKLMGQIRRFKTETENKIKKKSLKNLFKRHK